MMIVPLVIYLCMRSGICTDTIGQRPSLAYTTVVVEQLPKIPVFSDKLSRELLLDYHQLPLDYHQLLLNYQGKLVIIGDNW